MQSVFLQHLLHHSQLRPNLNPDNSTSDLAVQVTVKVQFIINVV